MTFEVSPAVDACVPRPLRQEIEARYWAPIGLASAVERFIDDPALYAAPDRHPALFSDHGVVHVRDIAGSAAQLAMRLPASLLPLPRRERVRDLAVLLACFHDIGMVEPSAAGRRVHPQFAAQTVLGPGFDDLADALWQADAAGLRTAVLAAGLPPRVAREVMALTLAHSKSAVPAPLLDDRATLRRLMVYATTTPLALQRERGLPLPRQALPGPAPAGDGFGWLLAAHDLVDDVIAAVRVLRAADALRQRGTTLRTSAGYEVCTDRATGEAVVGLRTADHRMHLLLRFHNPISAAEANLRSTGIADDGALAVEFYRGAFAQAGVRAPLLQVTADVVADIEADALGSFAAGAEHPVRLGGAPDDAGFAHELAALLVQRHPRLAGRVQVVAGEPPVPAGPLPGWCSGPALAQPAGDLFAALHAHGLNVAALDRDAALAGTRCVQVAAGTQVLHAGSQAAFVVVPLATGLVLQPTGGYPPQPLHPWLPLGVTGVVRGGERNAGVVAQQALPLLLIPAAHYLAQWFRPYDLPGLRARLR